MSDPTLSDIDLKKRLWSELPLIVEALNIMILVCDASLHPSDPFSDVRSDQTLQDLAYMIVPKLFQRECERRKEFCKKNKIEYRMPKFKTKQGYIPGNNLVIDVPRHVRDTGHVRGCPSVGFIH